jgi:hypothetical protein
MERYLSAARKVSRLAVGNAAADPTVESFVVPDALAQSDRMSEICRSDQEVELG